MSMDYKEVTTPTLTLDPFQEVKDAEIIDLGTADPAGLNDSVLTPEERQMVDDFAKQIDFDNSTAILQYGAGTQKKMADFSENTAWELVEENLRRKNCCGVKLYPGYIKLPLNAPIYEPIYRLAAKYQKPVAVHMGLTSQPAAHLKYCHPLQLDEIAADHPDTQFVMCHFGSPFLESAAAVLAKNPNVAADLSGLLEAPLDLERYMTEQTGFVSLLRTWFAASNSWHKLLFGTDWPIINLGDYIEFIRRLVPEKHQNAVFFENANRIYGLGLK